MDNPVQLRLGFGSAVPAMVLDVELSGASVLARSDSATDGDVTDALVRCGVPVHVSSDGARFPTSQLAKLRSLPAQVRVCPGPNLAGLWELLTHPSADGLPAKVSKDPDGTFWLSWFDGVQDRSVHLPRAAAGGLLSSDIPVVADSDAFEELRGVAALPVLAGRGRVNLDGFIEISTSKPQLAESAPLPALFRVDATHLGMPLAYLDHFISTPGFVLDQPAPQYDSIPGPDTLPLDLTQHAGDEIRGMAEALASTGARAVAWETGLGRRVFALAAVALLEAWPALVVCPPATLWVWTRHARLLGRSWSLIGQGREADVYLCTYDDADPTSLPRDVACVVYDDVGGSKAKAARHVGTSVGTLADVYRIGLTTSWPSSENEVMEIMQLLRPAEFDVRVPVAARYPGQSRTRFTEHVACYLSLRKSGPELADSGFRESGVEVLQASKEQVEVLENLAARTDTPPAVLLAESMEVVSAGTARSLSPKIACTVARVREAASRGWTCVVLTKHARSMDLLARLLKEYSPVLVEADAVRARADIVGRVTLMRFDRDLPDLSAFDQVTAHDYPWSVAVLDAAVGPPNGNLGPLDVSIVHLEGSLDDRLAVYAVAQGEVASVQPTAQLPSASQMNWLLGRRGR